MKKSNLGIAILMLLLVFSSCTSDEILSPEEKSTTLLKSYTAKRDASGAYYLDVNVGNNVVVDKLQNNDSNTNEIYLSLSDKNTAQKNNFNSEMLFDGDKLKIEFINDNQSNNPSLTILDNDNAKLAQKSGYKKSFLSDYSVSMNENGTYTIDFNVESGVNVDFVFDEENSIHEIHLESGNENETSFSRTLTKEEGMLLNVHFVNHFNNLVIVSDYAEAHFLFIVWKCQTPSA